MKLHLYLLICFLCFGLPARAQTALNSESDKTLDSLLLSLSISVEDTNKVNTLNKISKQYLNTADYDKSLQFANRARQLANKMDYLKGLSLSYNIIGSVCLFQGDFSRALSNFDESLNIRIKTVDKAGIAATYNNIGLVYYNMGDFEKSINNYLKSLSVKEEMGDVFGAGSTYCNIGSIYLSQKNYDKALESYEHYLKLSEEVNDKYGIGQVCNNIGNVYNELGENTKAMQYHFRALAIRQEIDDKKGIAASYNNIGNVYSQLGDSGKALFNYQKSLKIYEEIGDKQGLGLSYLNIGVVYSVLTKQDDALPYLDKALKINKEIGDREGILNTYIAFSNLFSEKQDYEKAYLYHKLYSDLKDSLLNEQSSQQITEMNTRYDSEKKDKELIKKDAEIGRQQVEAEKRNFQRNAFIAGFLIVLCLVIFIFRGYRQKQTINLKLKEKNRLIENQKELVEEKNKKITASITYAKRIQQAILPSEKIITSFFSESFVFFKPKDIVSGDFYWVAEIEPSSSVLIAAVDCTGHGVPGALMSMMGYNLLEQAVKEHYIHQPAAILDELSKLVTESLHHTGEGEAVKDGMDIALCKIDYKNNSLEYAGAHNSLYLIRNGLVIQLKADKRSIGATARPSKFTNHQVNLEKGDSLYIFSDGFADQKGGPENKKFFYQPFRQLLLDIQQMSMEDQHRELEKVITEWKGTKEQTDDILIVGIQV